MSNITHALEATGDVKIDTKKKVRDREGIKFKGIQVNDRKNGRNPEGTPFKVVAVKVPYVTMRNGLEVVPRNISNGIKTLQEVAAGMDRRRR